MPRAALRVALSAFAYLRDSTFHVGDHSVSQSDDLMASSS
jgi:hypothetical protein